MVWSYISFIGRKLAGRLAAAVMLLRSQAFYILFASLIAFPRTYLLVYQSIKKFSIQGLLTDSILVFSEELGASVYKMFKGLQLLNGKISATETVELFQLPGLVSNLPDASLALFLIISGFLTPYIFYRLMRRFVIFASSRTPGIVHYVFITLLFVSLVVLYGVRHGLGLDFFTVFVQELDTLVEGFLQNQAGNGSAVRT